MRGWSSLDLYATGAVNGWLAREDCSADDEYSASASRGTDRTQSSGAESEFRDGLRRPHDSVSEPVRPAREGGRMGERDCDAGP